MKLAVLCDAIYPYTQGGREALHFQRSTRLARRGHAVRIYTSHWWPEREGEIVRDGVVLHAITPRMMLYTRRGRRSKLRAIGFGLGALRLLWSPEFDVLDVDQFPFTHFFAARLVCALRRRPMTATWHDVWDAATWRRRAGWLAPVGIVLQRAAARQADLVFANSALTATRLTNWLGVDPRRVLILPPSGVESLPSREALPKTIDCIFVGRLVPHTHVDVLLHALATLPEVTAVIVGNGPERPRLEALVTRLGLASRVGFESPGSHEAVLERLRAARLLTFPSTREGFGIAVLEANACGVPALIVKHPDNAALEMVRQGENGLVCGLDTARMAEAIRGFLADPACQLRMSKAARSVASTYSWETYVTRMVGSLQSLIRHDLESAA
ncbi:MAG: glycosyltransferase family 4 protein [Candidatus Dormibacter sp.]